MSELRQHLLFLHRLTSLSHQLLLSWFVPYLSSMVGQHPNEVTSLTMSCDSRMAYITSRLWFLGSSRSRFIITGGTFLGTASSSFDRFREKLHEALPSLVDPSLS